METEKKSAKRSAPKPDIINSEKGGSFRRMPTFWFVPGGQIQLSRAAGIPTSFWLYMFVVWADMVSPGRDSIADESRRWYCEKSMTQFSVRKSAAILWTNCLAVSGFFTVDKGTYEDRNPTKIFYREDTSQDEWESFISALCQTYARWKETKFSPDKNPLHFAAHVAVRLHVGHLNPEWLARQISYKFIEKCEGAFTLLWPKKYFGEAFRDKFDYNQDYLSVLVQREDWKNNAA